MSAQTLAPSLEGRTPRKARSDVIGLPMAIGLVLVGLFSFAAIVLLLGYSDEMRSDPAQPATASDPSAVGFAGLQVLLRELGYEVRVDPYPAKPDWNGRDLRLYFPTQRVSESRAERFDTDVPGLVVLPKWRVSREREGSDDVVRLSTPGLADRAADILNSLEPTHVVNVHASVQHDWRISGLPGAARISHPHWIGHVGDVNDAAAEPEAADESEAEPAEEGGDEAAPDGNPLEDVFNLPDFGADMIETQTPPPSDWDAVLHPLDRFTVVVLSDADLLSNHGIATEGRARMAVALLERVADDFGITDPVFVFDDNLHRADTRQNLVKLLTRPPFLAATLCLLAAGALVAWQGFNRFGAPRDDSDDAASKGPRALAETAALFVTESGRARGLAPGYAEVVRRQALERLGLSVWDRARADAALRARETSRNIAPTFAQLSSDTSLDPMNRVRALQRWKQEMTR